MPALPAELINAILEKAFYEFEGHRDPDYKTILASSLVASSWMGPAQRLLFRHITLRRARSLLEGFVFTSPPNTHSDTLVGYIRILEVPIGQSTWGACDYDHLAMLISRCTRLYELLMWVAHIVPFTAAASSRLERIAGAGVINIRAFKVYGYDFASTTFYKLLSIFPTVQFLLIGLDSPEGIGLQPPNCPAPDLQLYELTLREAISSEVLVWLLPPSNTTLRVLELRHSLAETEINLLMNHGQRIRSLRMVVHHIDEMTQAVGLCPHLEELVLLYYFSPISLPDLPPSLEHFALLSEYSSPESSLQPVISAVHALPNLRLVSCDLGTFQHPEFPQLKMKCDEKGVETEMCGSSPYTDDQVIAKHFPRHTSVSNFRLMN